MNVQSVVIVSPALAAANNGNWQTARRWQQMLGRHVRTRICREWPDHEAAGDTVMLALHARRSAASVLAWARAHPGYGLAVVLTGTDLYRDIHVDAAAQQSLALAQRLVVLQARGPEQLPEGLRSRTRIVYQSSTTRQPLAKTGRHLRVLAVGHLRNEKSPQTLMQAARLIAPGERILIDQIGAGLDAALADQARTTQADCPHYRWLGARAHEATRRHIQRAHVLVHPSRMEGGAHVIMEAVTSGTPVLASRIPGNLGMLGDDYGGYFEPGDAEGLVRLLRQWRDATATAAITADSLPARVRAQCDARAALFAPANEQQALLDLMDDLLHSP